jgi:hypothetical protein
MAEDRLIVLLNIDLANDVARGIRVEGIRRRPIEQITRGALEIFLQAAGQPRPSAIA